MQNQKQSDRESPVQSARPQSSPRASNPPRAVEQGSQDPQVDGPVQLADVAREVVGSFRKYAVQRPDAVALWAFGIGFIVGWRLKPW